MKRLNQILLTMDGRQVPLPAYESKGDEGLDNLANFRRKGSHVNTMTPVTIGTSRTRAPRTESIAPTSKAEDEEEYLDDPDVRTLVRKDDNQTSLFDQSNSSSIKSSSEPSMTLHRRYSIQIPRNRTLSLNVVAQLIMSGLNDNAKFERVWLIGHNQNVMMTTKLIQLWPQGV